MVRGFVLALALTTAGLVCSGPATAADQPSAAHAIAQKFAEKPAEKPSVAPFAKPKAEAETTTSAQRPPIDYEMDMLRRARAERTEREKAAPSASITKVAAPSAMQQPLSTVTAPQPAAPVAAPTPIAAPVAPPATVPQKIVEAPAQPAAAPAPEVSKPVAQAPDVRAKADTPATSEPTAKAAASPAGPAAQASILLAIETDGASSSGSDSLDPIICFGETCFISAGLTADAIKISKADALKLKSTTEASPDSCKGKIACVYRNVGLEKGALLQLIELGSASHDPSSTFVTHPDMSCKVSDGALICDNPIATPDFRVWVVPETTAKTAGTQGIENAVADGLPHVDVARNTDK